MGASIRDCGGIEMSGCRCNHGVEACSVSYRDMDCVAGRVSLVRCLCWRAMVRRYRLRAGCGR